MRLGGLCCCCRLRNKVTSAASERRRLFFLVAGGLGALLVCWSFLLHRGLELRDLPSLMRDRNVAMEIRSILPKLTSGAADSGCPANTSCISMATTAFGSYSYWRMVLQPELVPSCASNCQLIADQSQAHALLFHAFDLPSRRRLRYMRQTLPSNQFWVYYSLESPVHLVTNQCVRDCLFSPWIPFIGSALAFAKEFVFPSYLLRAYPDTTEEAGFFNWTITYRRDSTIYTPYSRFATITDQKANEKEWSIAPPPKVSLMQRKYLSFIVVSNCHPYNRRQEVLTELAKHMELHVYGTCGDRVLPSSVSITELSKQYYFHISFENAFCRDYITEKFFSNGLLGHAVPVAFAGYSREDLEAVAPPHSFLYAGDYKSPAALANRLKSLAADPGEYGAYHRWRQTHGIVDQARSRMYNLFCQLCRKLKASAGSSAQMDLNRFYNSGQQCRPTGYDPYSGTSNV